MPTRSSAFFSCFDRVVINATLVDIGNTTSATRWMNMHRHRIFDFPTLAKQWRDDIRDNAQRVAEQAGVALQSPCRP